MSEGTKKFTTHKKIECQVAHRSICEGLSAQPSVHLGIILAIAIWDNVEVPLSLNIES